MNNESEDFFKKFENAFEELANGILNIINIEDNWKIYLSIGAILGILFVEYQYFSTATEVRLLFVLFYIPVGAIVGIIPTLLLGVILSILVGFIVAVPRILLFIATITIVIGTVVLLYNTIVWTN